jgi:hypothetical protein
MKPISRRLRKLEEAFRLLPETEEERLLKQRLEEGRQRVAEARARGELDAGCEQGPIPQGLNVVEILQLGRQRARERSCGAAQPEASG